MDDSFLQLPRYLYRGEVLAAVFEKTDPKPILGGILHTRFSVNLTAEHVVLEYELRPKFEPVARTLDYKPIAAERGRLAHYELPVRLSQFSRERLEGIMVPRTYHLVPRVSDGMHARQGSPFAPHGKWEFMAVQPLDTTLRARLEVDRSIPPYRVVEALNWLSYHGGFERLLVTYEPSSKRG